MSKDFNNFCNIDDILFIYNFYIHGIMTRQKLRVPVIDLPYELETNISPFLDILPKNKKQQTRILSSS